MLCNEFSLLAASHAKQAHWIFVVDENMKKIIIGAVIAVLLAVWFTKSQKPVPGIVVTTKNGEVQGIISVSRDGREFYGWLGIPYAEPPVGDLRFASPRPAKKWSGVKDGSHYGPTCPQVQSLGTYVRFIGSEDCLHLNVHVPKLEGNKLLPVMVWIHGGAFIRGASSQYQADYFMDQDVVIVTVNYRLGPLGFLSTADGAIRGNMGPKDQALALKWVQENIKAFGGDPKKVTIFGESAGGASVHFQVISPKTKGLFKKAIAQSGTSLAPWALYHPKEVKKVTLEFSKSVGCHSEESLQVLKCLKGKSVEELLQGSVYDVVNFYGGNPDRDGKNLRPCIESIDDSEAFLTQHPLDIIESGNAHRIPFMTGVNTDEGLMTSAVLYKHPDRLKAFEANWTSNVIRQTAMPMDPKNQEEIAQSVKKFYLPKFDELSNDERCEAYTKLFTDISFNLPVDYLLTKQREYSPVYPYVYKRRGGPSVTALFGEYNDNLPTVLDALYAVLKLAWTRFLGFKGRDYGVCHGDELPMLFSLQGMIHVAKNDHDPDYLFSKALVKLWTDFAKDEKNLELAGFGFDPAPKSGPLAYFHMSENPSLTTPEYVRRTEYLKSLGF